MIESFDVIVVGAGLSGLMAGVHAAERGLAVLVLDSQQTVGGKFCYTAMGAAAVSNREIGFEGFHGRDARFVSDAIGSFDADSLQAWLRDRSVKLEAAEYYGLIQPVDGGGAVIGALVTALKDAGGELRTGVEVLSAGVQEDTFVVNAGERLTCRVLVLATGGPNLPQLGGSDKGLAIAQGIGHSVRTPTPSQVGLLVSEQWARELPGVWMDVELAVLDGKRELAHSAGSMLFTQAGLTGEAVFNLSHVVEPAIKESAELELLVNFHPGMAYQDVAEWMRRVFGGHSMEKATMALDRMVPLRLAEQLLKLQKAGDSTRVRQLDERQREGLLRDMTGARLTLTGTMEMRAAESCVGGVNVREMNPRTFESKRVPNLYVVGRMLDVNGRWGGFEQHFALGSGRLAGLSVLQ